MGRLENEIENLASPAFEPECGVFCWLFPFEGTFIFGLIISSA